MAKKFSIKRDPTFKATVNLPSPGQEPVPVEFTFKWMDRKEVAQLQDKWLDFYRECEPIALEKEWGNKEWAEARSEFEYGVLKSFVEAWDIEEEFNEENLKALVESSSDLSAVIVRGYISSYEQAKSGN